MTETTSCAFLKSAVRAESKRVSTSPVRDGAGSVGSFKEFKKVFGLAKRLFFAEGPVTESCHCL
jgi:hypothetical protein